MTRQYMAGKITTVITRLTPAIDVWQSSTNGGETPSTSTPILTSKKGGDMEQHLYRFRDGALDDIARARNCRTERQLAAALWISVEDLGALRHGALVGDPMRLHVAELMGHESALGPWLEAAAPDSIAV